MGIFTGGWFDDDLSSLATAGWFGESLPGSLSTIWAITENIKTILTGLGYVIEDLSGGADVCRLYYLGEDFGKTQGERPEYNEAFFEIRVEFRRKSPDLSRDEQEKRFEGDITVSSLNVGVLSISKLVRRVDHGEPEVDYEAPVSAVSYPLAIIYRH